MLTLIKVIRPPYQSDTPPLSKRQETKENIQVNIQSNIQLVSPMKKIAGYLVKQIQTFKPNFIPYNLDAWVVDIDKAIRLDKRTEAELIGCIDWMYSTDKGSFWIPNVMSGKKLREKFDTMEMQMMSDNKRNDDGFDSLLEEYNNAS